PEAVVEAFEKNGFIWGGKWFLFDQIHFEYRPELIILGQLAEG
ncbi:MAG: M15 family metallopeptidase, partial [Spirochaetaceae bacterium]|nr:M15 family metallopeptidase [Spirochaetaceae bacterium]